MDWEAVARLLATTTAPAIVIDSELRIALFDDRVARILRVAEDDADAPRALAELAERALEGAAADAECRIETVSGTRVDLALDLARVGDGAEACALLRVRSAFEHRAGAVGPDDAATEYEIGSALRPFGRLVRIVTDARVEHYWSGDAPRCHERLHGSATPCRDCPVLRAGPAHAATARRRGPDDDHEVVCVAARGRTIVLQIKRVRREELEALRASRLRDAVEAAGLTIGERTVLEHLVNGDSTTTIAATRGFTFARVRRYEEAILRKLGARARVDLMLGLF